MRDIIFHRSIVFMPSLHMHTSIELHVGQLASYHTTWTAPTKTKKTLPQALVFFPFFCFSFFRGCVFKCISPPCRPLPLLLMLVSTSHLASRARKRCGLPNRPSPSFSLALPLPRVLPWVETILLFSTVHAIVHAIHQWARDC
ncbi:unnamed protein product [Periconia digitata]|uniref:Uncharacterized protein n=1 Tax=Periconia digitata TaxID=1303443 RepID=A0A9W4UDU4_9PLEO|nr:unnamed protein product [Periconia digitata]